MPPFNGSGTFTPYTPGNPVVPGTVISSTAFNSTQSDIAAGLTNAVTRDGQSPPSANLPMGGKKLTGLAAGAVAGDSIRWEQLFSQGTEQDIASAATTDIGGLNTTVARITGTVAITSLGTNYNGPRYVRFAGILTLTHNATTLILPTGANITTAAGDSAIFVPKGNPADGWNCVEYQRASGAAVLALPVSSETVQGIVELATDAEALAGTDTSRAVTSAGIRAALSASGTAPIFACRAWLVLNGTGTPAIRGSGNVSSITDLGVGAYRMNFTTSMPTANYSWGFGGNNDGVSNAGILAKANVAPATGSFDFIVSTTSGPVDTTYVCVQIFC